MLRKILGLALPLVFSTAVFATDLSLEPCTNGGVSATGNFPTQVMEEQIEAYLEWRPDQPYYLFSVASGRIATPYAEGTTAADL